MKLSIIELKNRKKDVLPQVLMIKIWEVLAFEYIEIEINIDQKS